MKRITAILLALTILLCGCSEEQNGGTSATGPAATVDFAQTDSEMFTDRDYSTSYDNAAVITLSGDSASCSTAGVSISGSTVTITTEGTYLLSGSLNGSIVVDTDDQAKVQLVLSSAHIFNETGAAICILEADKVFITLEAGTENSLQSGETLEAIGEYAVDAALYSRCDLTLNGEGSLSVTAPASHGISGKDDLAITGGSYSVNCANQGLDANNSVRIGGGSFTIKSGKDGIHAEHGEDASLGFVYLSGGSFDIEAEGDGISASSYLQIENGSFDILAGGGYENGEQTNSGGYGDFPGGPGGPGGMGGGRPRSTDTSSTASDESTSMKGLKAAGGILISNGTFAIDSADDSIHSDTIITVNGGSFTIASGDDGVHAEDTLTITACAMTISTCYEGLEAEYIYIQGGDFTMTCNDDGLNASGGTDSSGTGGRDEMFGGGPGRPGGMNGGMGAGGTGAIDISGGTIRIYSGGDCMDSNGDLLISGGNIYATNYTSGDVSVLDSQNRPVITGGTYIGLGISTMMAETFSTESTQGVIACTVGNQPAGTKITITDNSGNEILSCETEYATVLMIVSTPDIVKGESYDVTVGTVSGTVKAS